MCLRRDRRCGIFAWEITSIEAMPHESIRACPDTISRIALTEQTRA
jgi:hypothetical protein